MAAAIPHAVSTRCGYRTLSMCNVWRTIRAATLRYAAGRPRSTHLASNRAASPGSSRTPAIAANTTSRVSVWFVYFGCSMGRPAPDRLTLGRNPRNEFSLRRFANRPMQPVDNTMVKAPKGSNPGMLNMSRASSFSNASLGVVLSSWLCTRLCCGPVAQTCPS